VQPIRLNLLPMSETDVGLEMISVGYSLSSSAGTGSGTKRSAVLTLDQVDEMFLYSLSETNPDEGQICSGDSGGPQLAKLDGSEEWVQVAVHSWGDTNCRTESGSSRVDVAWPWLLEQIAAVHGTADLCQINGRYEDGVCDEWCDEVDPDCVEVAGAEDAKGRACNVAAGVGGPWVLGLLALGWRRRR
jgi:hypothetical protein